jgi:hypothetical protein
MSAATATATAIAERPAAPAPSAPAVRPPSPARTHGPQTLFQVPFQSAMGYVEVERLSRTLSMTMCMHPRLHNSPAALGVVSLDGRSGLFLARGKDAGEWVLECRTWGEPPTELVRHWHVLAAEAAHELDPAVSAPRDLAAPVPDGSVRHVGRAENKRLSRFARRHMGLE